MTLLLNWFLHFGMGAAIFAALFSPWFVLGCLWLALTVAAFALVLSGSARRTRK